MKPKIPHGLILPFLEWLQCNHTLKVSNGQSVIAQHRKNGKTAHIYLNRKLNKYGADLYRSFCKSWLSKDKDFIQSLNDRANKNPFAKTVVNFFDK